MTLGELIDFLSKRDLSKEIAFGFGEPHSYRGDYSELAFEPVRNTTVGDMLKAAESALGREFTGYKGGQFLMGKWVDCFLANYGDCGEGIGPVLLKFMCGEQP